MIRKNKLLAIISTLSLSLGLFVGHISNKYNPACAEGNVNTLVDGEYYILNNDQTVALSTVSYGGSPSGSPEALSLPWTFTKQSNGQYKISADINGVEHKLGSTSTNTGIRTNNYSGATYDKWNYDSDNKYLSIDISSTLRIYLGYNSNGKCWQGYQSTLKNGTYPSPTYSNTNFEVNIVSKADHDTYMSNKTKASLRLSYTKDASDNIDITNIGLRFGGAITKNLKDRIESEVGNTATYTYGVKYSYTRSDNSIVNNRTTTGAYVANYGDGIEVEANEANFYQSFVLIKNFPLTDLKTVITAQCYVSITVNGNSTEYVMEPMSYSIKDMVDIYLGSKTPLTNEELTTYSEILSYLQSECNK